MQTSTLMHTGSAAQIPETSLSTYGEEEVEEVGEGQRGQAEQPQQNCEGCQALSLELSQTKDLEAQHNACMKICLSDCKKNELIMPSEFTNEGFLKQQPRVQCACQT